MTQRQGLIKQLSEGSISPEKAKKEYKKIVPGKEKDRYHILRDRAEMVGNRAKTTFVIQIFTVQDWESRRNMSGQIVAPGIEKTLKNDGNGDVTILWNPTTDYTPPVILPKEKTEDEKLEEELKDLRAAKKTEELKKELAELKKEKKDVPRETLDKK